MSRLGISSPDEFLVSDGQSMKSQTWNTNWSFQTGLTALREMILLFCLAQSTGIPHSWTSTWGLALWFDGHTYCPDISWSSHTPSLHSLEKNKWTGWVTWESFMWTVIEGSMKSKTASSRKTKYYDVKMYEKERQWLCRIYFKNKAQNKERRH